MIGDDAGGRTCRRPVPPGGVTARRGLRPVLVVLAALTVVAVAAPLLVPADALSVIAGAGPALAPPSLRYPLGTDENGLSVLALTVAGAGFSLRVGLVATVLAASTGAAVGLLAGAVRGRLEGALMQVVEWFLVLPQVPFAAALAGVLGRGAVELVAAIAVTSWAVVAQVVRAAVLAAASLPSVERVQALGARRGHVIRAHILPEVLPVVAVSAVLTLANSLLAEAALSFLGAGSLDQVSWGSMLRSAATSGAVTAGAWWYVAAPGLAIIAAVSAAAWCAEALHPAPQR